MSPSQLGELFTGAFTLVLSLSLPALAASLLAQLAVGAIQSATHVQDPSLTTVPRVAAVLAAVAFAGASMATQLVAFTTDLFTRLPTLVP